MNLGPASSATEAAELIYKKEEKPKDTRFTCSECGFKSPYRYNRDRHLSLVHGIDHPSAREEVDNIWEKKKKVEDKSSQTDAVGVGLYGILEPEKKKEKIITKPLQPPLSKVAVVAPVAPVERGAPWADEVEEPPQEEELPSAPAEEEDMEEVDEDEREPLPEELPIPEEQAPEEKKVDGELKAKFLRIHADTVVLYADDIMILCR